MSWPLLIFILLFPALAAAAELTDLGQGLGYRRLHSLAEGETRLRAAIPDTGALVLDLRYVAADDESAGVLRAALEARAPNSLLLLLLSPATPPAVARAVGESRTAILTLGAPGSQPRPKVVVNTDPAADRRAYDSWEAGTPVDALISGKIEKERFDEAALVHEFMNGSQNAAPAPTADPTVPKEPDASGTAGSPAAARTEPPIDRVLQRAVHLHRALSALRR